MKIINNLSVNKVCKEAPKTWALFNNFNIFIN